MEQKEVAAGVVYDEVSTEPAPVGDGLGDGCGVIVGSGDGDGEGLGDTVGDGEGLGDTVGDGDGEGLAITVK